MNGPQRNNFGQRNVKTPESGEVAPRSDIRRPLNPEGISREDHSARSTFHDSFIERNWPKFGAAAVALIAIFTSEHEKFSVFQIGLVAILAGAFVYFVLNSVRKKLNDLHTVRTKSFQSPRFAVGAALGLAYFLYSVLLASPPTYDNEFAKAAAEFTSPIAPFQDGFQREDLGALAMLILKAAGAAAFGGLIVSAIVTRFLGE